MAIRRRIPVNPRLAIQAVVAVLLGLAMLGLKARVPHRLLGRPVPLPPAGGSFLVAALLALAIPGIVLATIAALRLRRPPPSNHDRPTQRRSHRWLGAAILLALLAGTIAAAALAARLAAPSPSPSLDRPTAPTTTATPAAADPPSGPTDDQAWLLFAAVVLLVLLVAAAFAHRQTQEIDHSPTPALVRAVEQAIAAIADPAHDPRTAIIDCYAAMERALTTVPAATPHAADSPTEVLDRAVSAGAIRSPGAWRLVELFDEARFSPHPMTEANRAQAANALKRILDELRSRR